MSAEGAVAAIINIAGGHPIGVALGFALAVTAAGVVIIGLASEDAGAPSRDPRLATLLALGAATLFGISSITFGRLAGELPLAWPLVTARVTGVVGITAPLAVLRRMPRPGRAAPLIVISGLAELGGLGSFAVASHVDLTVASVLASQFATITAIAAWVIFRERLSTWQIVGVTAVIGGVAVLALLNA